MHFVLILDQLKSRPLEPEGGGGGGGVGAHPAHPPPPTVCMFTNFHF